MPRAVASTQTTEKKELKSCPGGFVELRRLTYGQKLERQSMAMQSSIKGEGKKAEMNMVLMQQMVTAYEFRHCIADHNLEDDNGVKLNFANQQHVFALDPRIGEEIGNLIDDMNNFEEGDEAENSASGSGQL